MKNFKYNGGDFYNFDNDNNGVAFDNSYIEFNNVEMKGGFVQQYLTHGAFINCFFTGNYSQFPLNTQVMMKGNLIKDGVTGIPKQSAILPAPFSGYSDNTAIEVADEATALSLSTANPNNIYYTV